MWKELLFKGHQVLKSITSSWNRGSGILSHRVIHIHLQHPWAKEGQATGCAYVPASQLAAGAAGKCRWPSLPRLRIFTFSNLLSNSLNGMKQCAATPVPRCLRGHRAGCQKRNFCHCNQHITAFYAFHTFLTLQCLWNIELIHQISTQSRKLHDSFGSLHNQTPKPKFHNCRQRHLKHAHGTLQNHSINTGFHF